MHGPTLLINRNTLISHITKIDNATEATERDRVWN